MTKKMLIIGIAVSALAACGGGQRTIHREAPVHRSAPPPSKPVAAVVTAPTTPAPTPSTAQVKIPPGHMPPSGKCRIWYPGRPPGHQPPVGECADLRNRVPSGAVLVEGPAAAAPARTTAATTVPATAPAVTPKAAVASAPASQQVKVPPGHMPPQGKCRIWYPKRPPGKQPAIGECAVLEKQVPQGAVLVRG